MTLRKITAAAGTLVLSSAAFVGLAAPASAAISDGTSGIYGAVSYSSGDAAFFDDMYFEVYNSSGAVVFSTTPRSATSGSSSISGSDFNCQWVNNVYNNWFECLSVPVGTYTIGIAGQDPTVDVYVTDVIVDTYIVDEPLADTPATFTTVPNMFTSIFLDYEITDGLTSAWVSEFTVAPEDDAAMANATLEVYNAGGTLVYSTRTYAATVLAGSSDFTPVLGGTCFDGSFDKSGGTNFYFYCFGLPVGDYTVGVSGAEFAFTVESAHVEYQYLVAEPLAGSSSTLALDSTLDYLTTITYSEVLAATGLSSEFLNGSVFAAVGLIGLGAGALVLARRRQGAAV